MIERLIINIEMKNKLKYLIIYNIIKNNKKSK